MARPTPSSRNTKFDACELARVLLEDTRTDTLGLSLSADLVRHGSTADASVKHTTLADPRECDACDDGWALLEEDALDDGHYERALSYKDRIRTYIGKHLDCTMDDLRGHFGCPDATLRICLHLLVDRHEINGVDPYACGASKGYDELHTYCTIYLPLRSSE